MARRILILFAHPAFQKSRCHRRLAAAARAVEGVTFHDLYEEYPDFLIDTAAEQKLLREHDIVVFQHPLYWYSCPSLLKEWMDLVLEHGFAHGEGGDALKGKLHFSVISAGGPEAAYCCEGYNVFTIAQLLTPFEQTARLCGMDRGAPFLVHDAFRISDHELEQRANDYTGLLTALRDGAEAAVNTNVESGVRP